MITNEDLILSYQKLAFDLEPLKRELAEAKAKFNSKALEVEAPYLELLEKYYDEKLIDINGKSVNVGDFITNKKATFKVINRGMQFVFGEMMFNPRVICQKLRDNGEPSVYGKEKHIHPAELKEYAVL
jgi:hypothetical protein